LFAAAADVEEEVVVAEEEDNEDDDDDDLSSVALVAFGVTCSWIAEAIQFLCIIWQHLFEEHKTI
jgi:hypothetical protein